jgi:hypothetical protein
MATLGLPRPPIAKPCPPRPPIAKLRPPIAKPRAPIPPLHGSKRASASKIFKMPVWAARVMRWRVPSVAYWLCQSKSETLSALCN